MHCENSILILHFLHFVIFYFIKNLLVEQSAEYSKTIARLDLLPSSLSLRHAILNPHGRCLP